MVDIKDPGDFDVFLFEKLLGSLNFVKQNPTYEGLQQLEAELEEVMPWLEGLLEFPGTNEVVRREMQAQGEQYGPGRLQAILVLSDFFSLSETICASLMTSGTEHASRHGRSSPETAAILFNAFRRDLLSCITVLWSSTSPPRPHMPHPEPVDDDFAILMDETRAKLEEAWRAKSGGSMSEKLLGQIDKLQERVNDFLPPTGKYSTDVEQSERARYTEALRNAQYSNTQAPAEPIFYPQDMKDNRLKGLKAEQRSLARLVYLKAVRQETIHENEEIIKVLLWLMGRTELDDVTKMVYAAWIVSLMPIAHDKDNSMTLRQDYMAILLESERFTTICQGQILSIDKWKCEPLQRIVLLEWAIFLEVMDRSRFKPKDKRFSHKDGTYSRHNIEMFIQSTIRSGAFSCFRTFLQSFPVLADKSEELAFSPPVTWPEVDPEYSEIIMSAALRAIVAFVHTFQAIKKLKATEDEQKSLADRRGSGDGHLRNDLKEFFELTVDLYSRVTDIESHHGWAGAKLLELMAEYVVNHNGADADILAKMLAAISRTPASVHLLFNYLKQERSTGSLTFEQIHRFFSTISGQQAALTRRQSDKPPPTVTTQQRPSAQSPQPSDAQKAETLKHEDATIAAYCQLMTGLVTRDRYVAKDLISVRFDGLDGGFLRDLLTLLNRETPSAQRAAVIDAITAFGYALGQVEDYRAARMILTEMSELGIYPVSSSDWLLTLVRADQSVKGSLALTALVNMFTCVLQSQERYVTVALANGEAYKSTMRNNVSHLMVNFVMDDVLTTARGMDRTTSSEAHANLLEAVLCFVDRNLLSFDLETLVEAFTPGKAPQGRTALSMLTNAVEQPGADILQRILSDQRTFESITTPAFLGHEKLRTSGSASIKSLAAQGVRVVYRILQRQTAFIQMLRPLLDTHQAQLATHWFKVKNFYPLDRHLEGKPDSVAAIASYLAIDMRADLAMFSVKVLAYLGESASFVTSTLIHGVPHLSSRLARIISTSPESAVIMAGFVERLNAIAESPLDQRREQPKLLQVMDGFTSKTILSHHLFAGTADEAVIFDNVTWLLRSAVLDLLLAESRHDQPGPTLAHFLLGLTSDGEQFVENIVSPSEIGASRNCLHLALEQLLAGLPADDEADSDGKQALSEADPYLAEKTMRLVYQLAGHDVISTVVTRYLRNQEDFVHRNLRCLRVKAPYREGSLAGIAQYGDGSSVQTTNADLTAVLATQSLVLDLAALEMHLLSAGSPDSALLVKAFLESSSHISQVNDDAFEDYLEQSSPLCLELLAHLDIEWQDLIDKGAISPQFFANLDFEGLRGQNEDGIPLYDIEGLRLAMEQQVVINSKLQSYSTDEARNAIRKERENIIEYLATQNDKGLAEGAAVKCLQSWMKFLEVILYKGFDTAPTETRQAILFDLLKSCFVSLSPNSHLSEQRASLLSQTVFSLTTVLREQLVIATPSLESMPLDQLSDLLSQILTAVADNGINELGRGHLYASLLNFMQIVRSAGSEGQSSAGSSMSLTSSTFNNGRKSILGTHTVDLIDKNLDKIMEVVCRDAASGSEVWQAASYSVLESIMAEASEKQSQKFVSYLSRAGYLQTFVRGLERSDSSMRQALQQEPDGLDSVFAVQARLALLQRLAQTALGCQKLIEAGILQVLGNCSFIDARPDRSVATIDSEAAFSASLERYYDLVKPVLYLVELVLLHANAADCKKTYKQFVGGHRETFLGFLRERPSTMCLASISTIQQIVTILSLIVSTAERSSLLGWEAFDVSLKSLGSRYFEDTVWGDLIVPLGPEEEQEDRLIGPNELSAFAERGGHIVRSLLRSLLFYYARHGGSSSERGFEPMLASGGVVGLGGAPNKASLPTLSQTVYLFHHRLEDLLDSLSDCEDYTYKLSQGDQLSSAEVDDLLEQGLSAPVKRLGFSQKLELATRILTGLATGARQQVFENLDSVELLLILLNRHILFYTARQSERTSEGSNLSYISTRSNNDVPVYTRDAIAAVEQMGTALDQLRQIELSGILGGEVVQSREVFLKLLVKRMSDIEVTNE